MKKLLSALMAILLLLGCVPVLADGSVYSGMPQGVQEYLIRSMRIAGFTIDGHIRPAGGDTTFVAITDDGIRRLMCFELGDGQWTLRWNRKNAMPVTSGDVSLRELSGVTVGGLTLGTAFGVRDTKSQWECIWEKSGKTWQLRLICWHDTDDAILEAYRVEEGVVKYEGWRKEGQQRIYGTLQSDLRYFSWQDFPFDPDELRTVMSNPPRIPEGNLTAKRIQFTGGKKYPVYNGPGEAYGQSGSGTAHVSTNDWIQVFGEEDGWIMIQYDITREHMRIGWIDADALPSSARVTQLSFTPVTTVVTTGVSLTDDPLGEQGSIGYVREGVTVQWLATMGDWAYIESTDGSLLRGFVPLARIAADGEWEK